MLRVSRLNGYAYTKTTSGVASNSGRVSDIPVKNFKDSVAFAAKKIDQNVTDKIQNSAKGLGDGGKLKQLLKAYPIVDSSKMIKVDISETRYSASQGEPPDLSVKYNIWDNYLSGYSLKYGDTTETKTFDFKGKPSSATIERSVENANLVKIFTGNEKTPFSIKVQNKPAGFYSENSTGNVEKRYVTPSAKSSASTLESYGFALSNVRTFHYAIGYPGKNQKNFTVYRGPNSEAYFSTLELAREHIFELLNNNCGVSAMEKLKGYVQLLDLAEQGKL